MLGELRWPLCGRGPAPFARGAPSTTRRELHPGRSGWSSTSIRAMSPSRKRVDMAHPPSVEERALQVSDHLLDLDCDGAVRPGVDRDGCHRRIDDAPLPMPVVADGVASCRRPPSHALTQSTSRAISLRTASMSRALKASLDQEDLSRQVRAPRSVLGGSDGRERAVLPWLPRLRRWRTAWSSPSARHRLRRRRARWSRAGSRRPQRAL